jgi:TolB-like protein/DNA-binding winged helix-turn-helix (wHTH) protein/Tfp pilus assembly protein PilF
MSAADSPEIRSGAYIVGDLYVDVGQQRVTRAGSDIGLPNLSFQLLVALVRAAPNVLSNESLMTQVWPGLVVSPETVSKRVNLLREALGDDPREPRYITGVRSRGYRLIASVSRDTEGAPLPNLPTPIPEGSARAAELPVPPIPVEVHPPQLPTSRSRLQRWAALSVLTAGVLIAAAIGVRWAARHQIEGTIPAPAAPATTTAAVGTLSRTVAVLPFDSISADPADAYLALGLPEMILNRLSRIDGLSVIARNSSFALATKSIDSREIGRRLNSGYLIGGSVQREADRLRVAVHLVDSASGTMLWSAHFDRGLHDIFSIEDEIADQLAGALSLRLGEPEPKLPAGERSANLEAYLAFLQGRALLGRFTVAESEAAVPYLEKAIALDSNFASAYASLYDARMQAADQRREDLALARERYRHLVDRALQLDPQSGRAYFARAMWANEPTIAGRAPSGNASTTARESDFRQGAALDPSNGRGLVAYAQFVSWILERPDEGRRILKRALWVDPMSPSARFTDAELSLDDSGVKASEQKNLQVLELDPNFVPALQRFGRLRWLIDGKLAEAIQIMEHGIALDPKNLWLGHAAMAVYLDLGDAQAARAVVAGMPPSPREVGLLAMHEGDWRRAGLSAYDEAGWTSDSEYCELWQGEALRDYALRTGEFDRAIAFIKLKFYLGDAPAQHLEVCNDVAAVYLSELLAASGQPQQAIALRRAAASWNDANEAKYLGGSRRLRARVLLLDGKPDAALAELAESFRSGSYAYWWYTLNHDPLWLPLHGDTRFQAIADDVRRYVDAERSQLEALRRHGDVPRREAPGTARAERQHAR